MPALAKSKATSLERAAVLAERLGSGLRRERIVPRFVDRYVVEHGRYGLQVHAALYRDLLTLLEREALLTLAAQALDFAARGTTPVAGRSWEPMKRKDASAFRERFLLALARAQHWNGGAALEFQSDLKMYEEILSRNAPPRRPPKPFEVTSHPFVDRSAFVLDSSFLEPARLAASRALRDLETLAAQLTEEVFAPQAS